MSKVSEFIELLRSQVNRGIYCWGGNGNNYVKGLPPEKLYNQIFAPQAEDFKREFGTDGSYFFIDYKPQKHVLYALIHNGRHMRKIRTAQRNILRKRARALGRRSLTG